MPPKYSREITEPIVLGHQLKTQFRTSPCEAACPAGTSIQKVQALVEEGEFTEALRYLTAKSPFPGITGRVCPHFCQQKCNRSHLDACVSTRALERSVVDFAEKYTPIKRRSATGKNVGVVGGGPAGLTAAYFLSLLGHEVTVYEAAPLLGGVPRYAIPNFRLPRHIVDREVGWVLDCGVKARMNTVVGKDVSFEDLRRDHDAVLVATGMPRERSLPIPHADKAVKAVEFLKLAALGIAGSVGKRVVIMGGGGVAFDCAFTARRLGAEEVHVICLEKAGAMRAPQEDLDQAARENVFIHNSCTMSAISCEDGHVSGAEFYEVAESKFDESGRLTLIPAENGEHSLACDTVIFAVGLMTDLEFMATSNAALSPRKCILCDEAQSASVSGIFAAGEVSLGPASVAAAIGQGRAAAFGIHAWLTGESSEVFALNEQNEIAPRPDLVGKTEPYVVPFEEIYSVSQYELRPEREKKTEPAAKGLNFEEIESGLTREAAMAEAAQCFHCGHCKACGTCVEDCPGYVLKLEEIQINGTTLSRPEVAFAEECWHCANCRTSCPCGAIGFEFPLRMIV